MDFKNLFFEWNFWKQTTIVISAIYFYPVLELLKYIEYVLKSREKYFFGLW